jgi:hypothetical protein
MIGFWDSKFSGAPPLLSLVVRPQEPSEGVYMKPLLPLLACAVLVCGAGRAADDEKPQDKAKAAGVAFVKAFNARDVDAMMKVSDVPFYGSPKGKDTVFEKADDLKADLKRRVGSLPADFRLPETVAEVLTLDELLKKGKEGAKADDPEVKMMRQVLGKDGYVVVLGAEKKRAGALLVAIKKDGKAKVVGMPE